MTKTIAIIGVGLIGGSFALAYKKNNPLAKIIGCSRQQSTLDKALSLGIIDEGFTDVCDTVKTADIVMICTPLCSYGALVSRMNVALKDGVIVTDAGSVKSGPSKTIIDNLDQKHHANFVPAHPIAGTEKSGPEAAFDSLYEGKKIILTPLETTSDEATQYVRDLWIAVGGVVEELNADRHDFIYATVSHAVQFISYGFGAAVAGKVDNADEDYRAFVRLSGSGFAMWRDIFTVNKPYLLGAMELFSQHFNNFIQQLEKEQTGMLYNRLVGASEKRQHFEALLKGSADEASLCVLQGAPNVWKALLPRIVACTVMETIAESEYAFATGAGLHSLSHPILQDAATNVQDLLHNKEELLFAAKEFSDMLAVLKTAVEADDVAQLQQICEQSQAEYNKVMSN